MTQTDRIEKFSPTRVLVVAQDSLAGAGLAALISEIPDCLVVAQTSEYEKLGDQISLYQPDVVVWEISPSLDSLAQLEDFVTPVITIVSGKEAAARAWSNGAQGVLSRNLGRAGLSAAINAVTHKLKVIDEYFSEAIEPAGPLAPRPLAEPLSQREMEVIQLVAEGMTNKSIASQLGISEHTVKFHLNSILGKLGAQSRTQAITLATRLGMIKL
jgi:DNA-binding NarL/FixJ family response regulator